MERHSSVTPPRVNGFGVLRSVLTKACLESGCSLGALTVLSPQIDPYRIDTPAGHANGKWLAEQLAHLVKRGKRIHWRGLFYKIVVAGDISKPDSSTFVNTEENWEWLQADAGKAARWLGYIPFDRISDNRNADPIVFRKASVKPEAFVSIGLDIKIPDVSDLEPKPFTAGFVGRQPYGFVMFGEKASLQDVLLPIARAKGADLYLPTGEISDTLVYQLAKEANDDGRPLVVFTFTDSDPAGRQMSVSIGRKLQAFKDLFFPELEFEVVPVALTIEQVRELNLPSTPLKATEKRADRWRAEFGVEQTEIDALETLRPNTLREIAEAAFTPYFDSTLEDRVEVAHEDWLEQAQIAIDEQINGAVLEALKEEATEKLASIEAMIAEINEKVRLAGDHFRLPIIAVPQPEIDEAAVRQALVSFEDDWVTATRALIQRKQYGAE